MTYILKRDELYKELASSARRQNGSVQVLLAVFGFQRVQGLAPTVLGDDIRPHGSPNVDNVDGRAILRVTRQVLAG